MILVNGEPLTVYVEAQYGNRPLRSHRPEKGRGYKGPELGQGLEDSWVQEAELKERRLFMESEPSKVMVELMRGWLNAS